MTSQKRPSQQPTDTRRPGYREQTVAAPQLVAVESLAFRVAAVPSSSGRSSPGLEVFAADMLRPVPLQRWDADDARLAGNSARFGGFMEGARCGRGSGKLWEHGVLNLSVQGTSLHRCCPKVLSRWLCHAICSAYTREPWYTAVELPNVCSSAQHSQQFLRCRGRVEHANHLPGCMH